MAKNGKMRRAILREDGRFYDQDGNCREDLTKEYLGRDFRDEVDSAPTRGNIKRRKDGGRLRSSARISSSMKTARTAASTGAIQGSLCGANLLSSSLRRGLTASAKEIRTSRSTRRANVLRRGGTRLTQPSPASRAIF
jgi:hypothetical protein